MAKNLQRTLKSYGERYWDFENFKRDGIHKIANYPAMMVAPMQHQLIEDILKMEPNIQNILDPFCGSGTTLVEGDFFNLHLIGIDINPLAHLITTAKLYGVNQETIYNSNENLIQNIEKNISINKSHYFFKIDKWFRADIIKDLTIIRESIILEKNHKHRIYYWVCFSDIIRKYSNTRSSTFKLHIKEKEKIDAMENTVLKDFIKMISENHKFLNQPSENLKTLIRGNSLDEMKKMEDCSIDFICTSPPYGDNGTTVTYGQYSILSLLWIDKNDLNMEDDVLLSNFSAIDSLSLGGKKNPSVYDIEKTPSTVLKNNIEKISFEKRKKVLSFMHDYFKAIDEMIRILKPNSLIVLTLGNRRVDNQEIQLDEITKEYCENNGMFLEAKILRKIISKRMPKKVSRVENCGPVDSMNTETVVILRKGK